MTPRQEAHLVDLHRAGETSPSTVVSIERVEVWEPCDVTQLGNATVTAADGTSYLEPLRF